jgi:hypothetical protein
LLEQVCTRSSGAFTFVAEGYGFRCAVTSQGQPDDMVVGCDMDPRMQHEWEAVYPATDLPLLNSGEVWESLEVGDSHACGVASKRLFCWGSNSDGQTDVPGLAYGEYWRHVSVGW